MRLDSPNFLSRLFGKVAPKKKRHSKTKASFAGKLETGEYLQEKAQALFEMQPILLAGACLDASKASEQAFLSNCKKFVFFHPASARADVFDGIEAAVANSISSKSNCIPALVAVDPAKAGLTPTSRQAFLKHGELVEARSLSLSRNALLSVVSLSKQELEEARGTARAVDKGGVVFKQRAMQVLAAKMVFDLMEKGVIVHS